MPWPGAGVVAYREWRRGARYLCAGMTMLYCSFLDAFGVPCRRVSLYTAPPGKPYDSHQAVEAFVDGRWIYMDPTFNISWKDGSGAYLDILEVADLLRARGRLPDPSSDGRRPIQRLQDFATPFDDYLNFIEIFEQDCYDGLSFRRTLIEARPFSWHLASDPAFYR